MPAVEFKPMIGGRTQVMGLLGWPVGHSLSPAMHNAAAARLGLDWVYVPFPVPPDKVEAAVRGLAALSIRGVNVTVPYKQAVIPFLDELDPAARAIGAVNTIVVGQRLTGYNTDWSGFLADLAGQGMAELAGKACLLLGAGGSARGVAYALAQAGASVTIVARRVEQAQAMAEGLQAHLGRAPLECRHFSQLHSLPPVDLIVNATPVGMAPAVEASPWPDALPLPPAALLYDLVYTPAWTRLRRQAEDAGIPSANGLGMLLQQGAQAFQLWTGQQPDLAVMAGALHQATGC